MMTTAAAIAISQVEAFWGTAHLISKYRRQIDKLLLSFIRKNFLPNFNFSLETRTGPPPIPRLRCLRGRHC